MKIKNIDKTRLQTVIKKVEETTSGEVVPIIVNQSDHYPASPLRAGLFTTFLLTPIGLFLNFIAPYQILLIMFISFLLGYFLGLIPFIKRLFSFRNEILEETHQRALQAFFGNNLHTTQDRTGILIFVSLLEHRAQIIADTGINEKVDQETWKVVLDALILEIKNKNLNKGLEQAIISCGEILSHHFPKKEGDKNELSDEVITKNN